ncbi:MAG: amidohydrolase family protein [Solobacterium sp.]|nr:amidohydrolase family protein [Solobacterium sp.]
MFSLKSLVEKLHIPLEDAVRFSSYNPAEKHDLKEKGELVPGNDFDAAVIDTEFNAVCTFVEGRKVFDLREEEVPYNKEFPENTRSRKKGKRGSDTQKTAGTRHNSMS